MNGIVLMDFTDTVNNYKLMHKWCSEKFIYEWFEQRVLSYDEIVAKYKNKLLNNKQKLYIINYDEQPIGFVQIYKYNDKKFDELKNYKNIYEYDIFIGESEYLSKGIGSKIVNDVDDYIYRKYLADCIILRPFKKNIRAVRCYQKNGFQVINEYIGTDTIGNNEEFVVLKNASNC